MDELGTAPVPQDARLLDRFLSFLSVVLVTTSIAWAFDVFRFLGFVLFTEQFAAGMLALAFLLLFLSVPVRKGAKRNNPAWYDVIAAIVGFVAAGYIAIRYPAIGTMMAFRPLDGILAGVVVIVLSLEGVRRTVGWALVVTVLVFIAYGLWGHLIPGQLAARPMDPQQLIFYLAFDSSAVLGLPIFIACTVVLAFVLFGNLLMATGGGDFFNDISVAAMGRYRGGSAKIAVASSALFGMVSGSAVANVVSGGIITIPMMVRAGYKPYQAAAIEAVASTGGGLMPPVMGAAAFVMAEYLQISYADVMIAAALPAILYYAVLFIIADLEAARAGIARVEEKLIPRTMPVLRAGWHFILPFVVMIYTLFWMNLQADESALLSGLTLIACTFVFGYRGKRPRLKQLYAAVRETGFSCLDLIMICVCAGIVTGILSVTGLGYGLTLIMVTFAKGSLMTLLLLAAGASIILGMGMPTVAVYVLLASLVAPAMVESGVLPIAAHLFVLYFGMMSFVTPPVALASFTAASIAKTDPFRTSFESMRFGWCAYIVPFLFVYSPTLILRGDWLAIVVDFSTALGGIWLISAAFVGYAFRPMSVLERAIYVLAGSFLIVPLALFPQAIYFNIAGVAIAAYLIGWEYFGRWRARQVARTAVPHI